MTQLLQINSSIFGDEGESTKLANIFVSLWKKVNPEGIVIVRDLKDCTIPHLDAGRFRAFVVAPDKRTQEQRAVIELSDMLIAEIKAADIIVIGAPMYNLTIPSALKAYIDHIARAGETFRYSKSGPIGLLEGKKAIIVAARGGLYHKAEDMVGTYLERVLQFLGIVDVNVIRAEGLAVSDTHRSHGLQSAERQMLDLLNNNNMSITLLEKCND